MVLIEEIKNDEKESDPVQKPGPASKETLQSLGITEDGLMDFTFGKKTENKNTLQLQEELRKFQLHKRDPIKNPPPETIPNDEALLHNINSIMDLHDQDKNEAYVPPTPINTKPTRKDLITPLDYKNGRNFEKEAYCWGQDLKELTIRIIVPENVRKSNQLKVKIQRHFLEVRVIEGNKVLCRGYFTDKIKESETCWTLVPGETLDIVLVKAYRR